MMSIEELITEIKKENKLAEKELFSRLQGKYLITCKRYVRNSEDAKERMLDGFFKFFITIQNFQYRHDEGLYEWIKRIMINECLKQLRNKSLFSITAESEAYDITDQDNIFNKISTDEIMQLVASLPLGYQTIFNLYAIDGYDHREIASILGIKEGSSKSQLSRARNLLKKILILNQTTYAKERSK